MCKQCVELADKYYPNLSDEDRFEVLMSATAFPFASPDYIEVQLIELIEETDGTLEGAMAFADAELDREWEEHKRDGG